jgi:hypothetical protein
MADITAASQEQDSGIEQVNQAVAQMDEVTQQNAALVEEAAAASQSMQDEAANLAQIVSFFKLAGMQTTASSKPVAKSASRLTVAAPKSVSTKPAKFAAVSTTVAAAKKKALPATANNDEWEEF